MISTRRFLPLAGLILFSTFLLAGCLSPGLRGADSSLRRLGRQKPSAELRPQDVVRIQMEALKYNDDKNRGIEIVYRFASPSNKTNTGPLPRFITMIKTEAYRPMLNHNSIEFGEIEVVGEQAAQRITISSEEGLLVVYVFVLSRQRGEECDGCWMTEAVYIESAQRVGGTV